MPLFEVNDFSKGITDNYLESNPTFSKKCDNFLIDEHRELEQRPGLTTFDTFTKQIPPGNQAIDGAYFFDGTIFVKSSTRLYYMEAGDAAWTTLDGPSNHAFADSEAGAQVSFSEWRGHLFITAGPTANITTGSRTVKVFRNASSVWTLRQAGMPRAADGTPGGIESTPSVSSGSADVGYYRWYCVFVSSYVAKVDGNNVTFRDVGSPALRFSGVFNPIASGNTATLHSLTYANATHENYPTSTMVVETYRTTSGGFIPKFAVSDALAASIVDNVEDDDLGDALVGDLRSPVLDNDPPPPAFFTDVVDSRMCYLGCQDIDSDEIQFDRYMESKPNDPDSVPSGNFARIEGKATGLTHVGINPIAMTAYKTYRMEGHYDLFGSGVVRSRVISESEGCVSNKGIVRTKDFILFPSLNGICWSDGFKVVNTTETHLLGRYNALFNKQNIAGVYNHRERRAYFAVESPNNSPANVNNELWVIDSRWSSDTGASITTCSMTSNNLRANDLLYEEDTGILMLADTRGYVAGFDPTETVDMIIPVTGDLDPTLNLAIVPHYISTAIRGPMRHLSIWMVRLFAVFSNESSGSLSVDFEGYDEDISSAYALLPERQRSTTGVHKVKRWWRKTKLAGIYKLFGIKKGTVNIVWSNDYDTATIVSDVATIDSGTWPTYGGESLIGYYLYLVGDSYTTGYLIIGQSGANLTLAVAPGNVAASAWEIKGIPKNECTHVKSAVVEYEILGENYRGYRSSDVGGNA